MEDSVESSLNAAVDNEGFLLSAGASEPLHDEIVHNMKVSLCWDQNVVKLSIDYFSFNNVTFVSYLSCGRSYDKMVLTSEFIKHGVRVSAKEIDKNSDIEVEKLLQRWNTNLGVLLNGDCNNTADILETASSLKLFDSTHVWLVYSLKASSMEYIDQKFQDLELSIDADVVLATNNGSCYELTDAYNYGKIQGNPLEKRFLGTWNSNEGLNIVIKGYKYYHRWNFNNLTFRAISVLLEKPMKFYPEILSESQYTPGVAAITKVASQLLNILKEQHNFRFNYTIASRWIGSPEPNSTLAVSNSLFWKEQDISSTSARIFPHWLSWVDIYFPPVTHLETKFYYLIPDKGVGDYENRFLTPMSDGVWWCSFGTGVVCAVVLGAAALLEKRKDPGSYAFFSVFATTCQQDYEDGIPLSADALSSQGRRCTLLVIGLTSMLLYNYYTSSVVSWLLNAAAPSIANLDALINSDLELIFEDIGYTKGWLDNPGFFYYSGFKNIKEDELRDKKVIEAKRKLDPLQPVEAGIALVRTGKFAYHTEPFTASQVISRTFTEQELCELGALPMMLPAPVYIYGQKNSPYREFFVWSLMRLQERGHIKASNARFAGTIPPCSGAMPRALALGQAAPAFVLLVEAALLSSVMLLVERIWYRRHRVKKARVIPPATFD
ncbi:ionotropic receptor 75a-like [Manduca sexta]|uniref:ionotropic receptor 75a-like n=1 Tax=Manduca sexta TaxID=7130 RepID=UPI00188DF604|nr:ionotropic receptor 75a-like [Manduca sexta]